MSQSRPGFSLTARCVTAVTRTRHKFLVVQSPRQISCIKACATHSRMITLSRDSWWSFCRGTRARNLRAAGPSQAATIILDDEAGSSDEADIIDLNVVHLADIRGKAPMQMQM